MKRDEFGPQYEQLLTDAASRGEAMTTTELAQATGSSRQRAFKWVETNQHRLRARGKNQYGAKKYVLAGDDERREPGAAGEVEVGTRMIVKRMRWQGGLTLELELDDGSTVVVDVRDQ